MMASPVRVCSDRRWTFGVMLLVALGWIGSSAALAVPGAISDPAPTPMCHASTLVETSDGILAAWAGGSGERKSDVSIWSSRWEAGRWSAPVQVINGKEKFQPQQACWNPVLFQPRDFPLCLFFKVGPSPESWWGKYLTSTDGGRTWSRPHRIPHGFLGPIRNKPVQLADGTILCGSSSEDRGWRIHVERLRLPFWDWDRTGDLNDRNEFDAIQPTIIVWSADRIQLLNRSKQGVVTESRSDDGGATWGAMARTELANPNSAVDAVRLADGRALLVHNPSSQSRSVLAASISVDGVKWRQVAVLEEGAGEYSYPAVIQARDGRVHVTYSADRKWIRHAVLELAALKNGP